MMSPRHGHYGLKNQQKSGVHQHFQTWREACGDFKLGILPIISDDGCLISELNSNIL